jgi:hypothetical protein
MAERCGGRPGAGVAAQKNLRGSQLQQAGLAVDSTGRQVRYGVSRRRREPDSGASPPGTPSYSIVRCKKRISPFMDVRINQNLLNRLGKLAVRQY